MSDSILLDGNDDETTTTRVDDGVAIIFHNQGKVSLQEDTIKDDIVVAEKKKTMS